jgi:hypothetical protein
LSSLELGFGPWTSLAHHLNKNVDSITKTRFQKNGDKTMVLREPSGSCNVYHCVVDVAFLSPLADGWQGASPRRWHFHEPTFIISASGKPTDKALVAEEEGSDVCRLRSGVRIKRGSLRDLRRRRLFRLRRRNICGDVRMFAVL